jgi:hypothetical protein
MVRSRCPNGTRRNKTSQLCEAKRNKSYSFRRKPCPKGTRRHKKTGECYSGKVKAEKAGTKLTQSEIETIMDEFTFSNDSERTKIRAKLNKLKYEPKYISCFTGKSLLTAWEQARDKVACYTKYGKTASF